MPCLSKHQVLVVILLGVLGPLGVLAATEILLSWLGVGESVTVVRPCKIEDKPGFCDNLSFMRSVFPVGMSRSATPYGFLEPKPANTFRIFVLGESAAYGDPDPAYSFSRYLDLMLRNRFPDTRFEVINTSITASNSHAMYRMAQELSRHQPDLFIVYAGSNEIIGPYGPGTTLTSQETGLSLIRASMATHSTRTWQVMEGATHKPREFRGMEMFLGEQITSDDPDLARTYRYFEQNLRDIASLSSAAGAHVIVSTFAANLRDCPPFHSMHNASLPDEAKEAWDRAWEEGKSAEAKGNWQAALVFYQSAEDLDANYAELQFRIARCLLKIGDAAHAKGRFAKSLELDTLRFRPDAGINDAVRHAAAQTSQDATLVDAEHLLASRAAYGIPGDEFFFDHVHLRPHGNYLLAAEFLSKIEPFLRQRKHAADLSNRPVLTEEECDRFLALTEYDRSRLARIMQHRLQRSPFSEQAYNTERLAAFQEEEREHTVELAASISAYEWALRQSPSDYLLRENFGMILYPFDREAALSQLRLSRPYHDVPLAMPDGTRVE
jgi:lysophospholipase L1-like esterase